eukprot:5007518-Prymnesium_polylepis.1
MNVRPQVPLPPSKASSAPAVAPRCHKLDVSFGSCGRVTGNQGITPLSGGKGIGSSRACTWYGRYY